MIKKILSSTLVMLMLGNVYASAHSIDYDIPKSVITTPNQNYKIIMPKEENVVTSEETVLISGIAKKSSKVLVSVYSSEDLFDTESFLLKNNITTEDELPIYTEETEVGDLGRFNVELELPLGRNKIVVEVNNNDTTYRFIRYISVTNEAIANEYIRKSNILSDGDMIYILKSIIESN